MKRYARNIQEYMSAIDDIGIMYEKNKVESDILWFRGHEQTGRHYYLEPGIYREIGSGKERNLLNSHKTYGTLWLKEEKRYQYFAARNYDKISMMPDSLIEWQEIMQHYGSKTRLMDWSESALQALAFSLEAFINPSEDQNVLHKKRYNMPVVWVLNPVELNKRVYHCFKNDSNLVHRACRDMDPQVFNSIFTELNQKQSKDYYWELEQKYNFGVYGLVSLSGLEKLRQSYGERLYSAVRDRSFNPFFYLLLRFYSDGIGVSVDTLPPLAIIHPYHSARIHEQKGAFTVFPYYEGGQPGIMQTSPYAMEYMTLCSGCLDEIEILDPDRIAKQLLKMGMRQYHMYPEMDFVAREQEKTK